MDPRTPVIISRPELAEYEIIFAKDQPQYRPLPALRLEDGTVITRWKLSLLERLRVLLFGNLFLSQLTFNDCLQPQLPSVDEPKLELNNA